MSAVMLVLQASLSRSWASGNRLKQLFQPWNFPTVSWGQDGKAVDGERKYMIHVPSQIYI